MTSLDSELTSGEVLDKIVRDMTNNYALQWKNEAMR